MLSRGAFVLFAQALLALNTVQAQSSTNTSTTSTEQYTGILKYKPSFAANAAFGAIYAVLGLMFSFHIIRRNDKWALCLPLGAFFSAAGYFIRLQLDPLNVRIMTYVLQQLFIIVSPSAFLAFNYMLYGRLITAVDPKFDGYSKSQSKMEKSRFSFIPPLIVGRTFVWSDAISFFVQMAAGGMLATASMRSLGDTLFTVGVSVQGISYCLFTALFTVTAMRLAADRRRSSMGQRGKGMDPNTRFIVVGLYLSSVFIMTRSIYRIIEFTQGYSGYLISHEVYMFALDAAPLILAIGVWSVVWPPALLATIAVETRQREQTPGQGQMQSNGSNNDWVPLV